MSIRYEEDNRDSKFTGDIKPGISPSNSNKKITETFEQYNPYVACKFRNF